MSNKRPFPNDDDDDKKEDTNKEVCTTVNGLNSLQVRKRDGTLEPFDVEKIQAAIRNAFLSWYQQNPKVSVENIKTYKNVIAPNMSNAVSKQVCEDLLANFEPVRFHIDRSCDNEGSQQQQTCGFDIETIQDTIEYVLHSKHYFDVAKHYILYRHDRQLKREREGAEIKLPDDIITPWGPVGLIVYGRTYSRRKSEHSQDKEEFIDTIKRVVKACNQDLHVGFTNQEERKLTEYLLKLKGSVAGRFLWQLGTETVKKLGSASLQNCAAVVVDTPVEPVCWAFDYLMLGSGVGANIQDKYISKIPPVLDINITVTRQDPDGKDAGFIIPDSREGWVELLRQTLQAFFITGKSFTFSAILVRGKGAPIKSFGGIASGPEELCNGIKNIVTILTNARGRQLIQREWLDVFNIVGTIVVSGNVRRSAQLIIGDADNVEFLQAKMWSLGNIPSWRSMSNNSVACNDIATLPDVFWKNFEVDENGVAKSEPYGLINLDLCKRVGRLVDGDKYPDLEVVAINPCGEQPLANKETCCLAELNLPLAENEEELRELAFMLYRICKHSLMLPCHDEETEKIVHKNMRIGLGVSGYTQVREEKKQWLPKLYEDLRAFDVEYSQKHGFNVSVKLTTVKPSGTLSLLPGISPGWHPSLFKYYIRTIRFASNSPYIPVFKAHGYPYEYELNFDGTENRNTYVVSFPCKSSEKALLACDVTAIQELEIIKNLQTFWSDNAVSCTVYYKEEELDGIKQWLLENYNSSVKSVSFLLTSKHGYVQAPFSEITQSQYETMIASCKPISESDLRNVKYCTVEDLDSNLECAGGVCPLK